MTIALIAVFILLTVLTATALVSATRFASHTEWMFLDPHFNEAAAKFQHR